MGEVLGRARKRAPILTKHDQVGAHVPSLELRPPAKLGRREPRLRPESQALSTIAFLGIGKAVRSSYRCRSSSGQKPRPRRCRALD
jgi:hypothetical protein